MEIFEKSFVNNTNSIEYRYNNKMAKISWGGYQYKRIDNREEIKDNKEANLYVLRA